MLQLMIEQARHGKLETAHGGGLAIVSAPFLRRPGIGVAFALCQARSAWLKDAIAEAPKRLEPSRDFRARLDPIGVDDVLPLQFPIVGLGKTRLVETGDTAITPGRVR